MSGRGVLRLRAVRFAQDDRDLLFTGGLSRGLSTARCAQDDRDLLFTGGFRAVWMEIQHFESLGAIPRVFEAGLSADPKCSGLGWCAGKEGDGWTVGGF